MTDEIKEIERILIILKKHNALADEEDTYLLDYITNLQQENDNLINLVKEFENKGYDIGQERADFLLEIKALQQENERLKENNQAMQEEMARVWEENERLKEELKWWQLQCDDLEMQIGESN